MSDFAELFRASLILLGLSGLLNTVQWLADRKHWADDSALGWNLQRLRKGRLWQSSVSDGLYRSSGLLGLVLLLAMASMMLIAGPQVMPPIPALLLFFATTALLAHRAEPDGADKILLVVASGLVLQAVGLACDNPMLKLAGVLWVGGQLALAYFAAGASKVLLAPWRDGTALQAALSSSMWGNRWSARLVERRSIALCLSWAIMVIEMTFPVALLMPLPVLAAVLAIFFLFHMAIALVMGLNSYPWAFLAAYPSAILLSQLFRSALGLG